MIDATSTWTLGDGVKPIPTVARTCCCLSPKRAFGQVQPLS